MNIVLGLLKAFFIGGAICAVGEALVLKTKLTPARILVGYVVLAGAACGGFVCRFPKGKSKP